MAVPLQALRKGLDTVTAWNHSRKGRIDGEIVHTTADGEWVDIRLTGDHRLKYVAPSNRGRTDHDGEIIRVRKSMLTELHEGTTPMTEVEELRAQVAHLTKVNEGLAKQVLRSADTLEAGRRELLATGWDAACDRATNDLTDAAPDYGAAVKADNPYRRPVPDFSGGVIACKVRDE